MLKFSYSELSTVLPTFAGVIDNGNNVYESAAPALVPLLTDISNFTLDQFLYWKFGFENDGEGTTAWQADDYDYGMKQEKRTGIGSFYFYPSSTEFYPKATPWNIAKLSDPIQCSGKVAYWSWLSTFFNFLIPEHRKMIEWVWSAMQDVGCEYTKKARRFIQSVNPEESLVDPTENFYDIKIGVLDAYPTYLDPEYKNYNITALKTLLHPNAPYSDIFVSEYVYKTLRDVCIDGYAVIPSTDPEKEDRFFQIIGRKSTIEPMDNPSVVTIKGDDILAPNTVFKLTADDPVEDISTYKIGFFWAEGINETVDVEWTDGPDKILKVICYAQAPNGSSIFVDIDTLIIAINSPHVDKWCTASNLSNPVIDYPLFWDEYSNWNNQSRECSDISYENILSFVPNEGGSGDWIPPEGQSWRYYNGYDISDPKTAGVTGEWFDDRSKYRHMIRVLGDLSYLTNNLNPQFYVTTGKKFQIDNYVIDLPILTPHITIESKFYTKDVDYTLYNNFVEFYKDPKVSTTTVDILYGPKIDVIEYFLYELYGKLCNLDWESYNYSNVTGKEAVRTIMNTLQILSTRYDFDRSSNVYGGLPISPFDGRVIGLYESYDYKILSINESNSTIKLDIPDDQKLHFFFIHGALILVNDLFESKIRNVDYDLATMEVESIDRFKVGDNINIKLPTNLKMKEMHDISYVPHQPPCIHLLAPIDFADLLKTYSDIFEQITNDRPEVLVWNQRNVDGVYHIMDATVNVSQTPGDSDVMIEYYQADPNMSTPLGITTYSARYNDYLKSGDGVTAQVHFHWATHKFLLIYDPKSERVYRAYIDSPIDTILSPDDTIEKGSTICRNISLIDGNEFSDFTEFNKFMQLNSVNNHNKILMVSGMPVKYGYHFPGKELES